MKSLIVVALMALSAFALAEEAKSEESTKQKRGLLDLDHAPAYLPSAPLLAKSYHTPIIHTAPVVTKIFEAPPIPLVRNYQPYITGPLITKGLGPHIYGAKTILPAPIIKAAPLYTAPYITKPILTHAPIISYAPKLAAPIAYTHGW